MDKSKQACTCRNITYAKIEEAVKNGNTSFEQVKQLLKFGNGCGECNDFIKYLIETFLEEQKIGEKIKAD